MHRHFTEMDVALLMYGGDIKKGSIFEYKLEEFNKEAIFILLLNVIIFRYLFTY